MTSPAISVILPVYNGSRYVREAIDSILLQNFTDFELIVINDGSQDNTPSILDEYAQSDERVVVIHQENKGLIASLNTGISLSRAEFIARMDADDIATSNRLRKQYDFMQSHPHIAVLGSGIRLIDDKGKTLRDALYPRAGTDMNEFILRGSPVAHPAVMMRKSIILQLGGYRAAYKNCEDYDLWLRLHETAIIDNLPDILLLYRQHDEKLSFRFAHQQALGSIVARLAHQARILGKTDPTSSLTELHASTLDLFDLSKDQRQKLQLEMLEATSNTLSLVQGTQALDETRKTLSGMPDGFRKIRARIYFRLARGYLEQKKYKECFFCLAKSLTINPLEIMRIIWIKVKIILMMCLHKLRAIIHK